MALLKALPHDTGLAFVLVQHLDPTHKSMMREILSRATPMTVANARDGVAVLPNHIYVNPPNGRLTIRRGMLRVRVSKRGQDRPPRTIDAFLMSLAKDQRRHAVAVILSGTGADGTAGVVAVRRAGGRTFAQDEASAKYNAMPRSVISTGSVEFVRPPAAIALELARLGETPSPRVPPVDKPEPMEPPLDGLGRIVSLLSAHTGIDFAHYKAPTLERRIRRRLGLVKAATLDEYARLLVRDPGELDALHRDLLIHVTSFFRDPKTFGFLALRIFPHVLKNRTPREPIRVWVPACSTGEEAYSIAILLQEFLKQSRHEVPVQVFATDVSASAIQKARAGIYPDSIASDVDAARLRQFFTKLGPKYQVVKSIRQMCVFAKHDVTRDPPFSKMNLISCRNLMIYLGPELQARVVPILHYALKPRGFLLLGPAETVGPFAHLFTVVDRKHKVYSRRGSGKGVPALVSTGRGDGDHAPDPSIVEQLIAPDTRGEADRIVLAKFAPAGVIINDQNEILQFRGRTGPYLEHAPGDARLQLMKMARDGLLTGLRSTLDRAMQRNLPARSGTLHVAQDGSRRPVTIEVVPLKSGPTSERRFLVLFEGPTSKKHAEPRPPGRTGEESLAPPTRVEQLENELAQAKDYLQSLIEAQEATNEELQSAHEEVLSNNEELQSTNEELETAQEELQSANEELTTLNEELQNRNASLSQLFNDLNNLISNIHVPIVIVGPDLRIRRFTPAAQKAFNLISTDVGRPLGNLRPNLSVQDLEPHVRETLGSLSPKEIEVKDASGRRHVLRIRPYRTEDNKIDGAVIALVDVEELQKSLDVMEKSRDISEAVVETVQQPLLVLSRELRVVHANRAFFQTFPVTPSDLTSKTFLDLGDGQWDIPGLRKRLTRAFQHDEPFENIEAERVFPKNVHKWVRVGGRRVKSEPWNDTVLLSVEDITADKEVNERLRKLHEDLESFNYSVSHDLRTPLQAIRGFAQNILQKQRPQLTPAVVHQLDNIVEASGRMGKIIEDLLQLSWMTRTDLVRQRVDLSATAKTILKRFRVRDQHRTVSVKVEDGLVAQADVRLVEIALENLISNAWKFTKNQARPRIEIGKATWDGRPHFFVRDNGVGFDMANASRMFQPFQRFHRPSEYEGTGIGLVIVRRIVERHGGRISGRATPGRGATFYFTLDR